MGAESHRRAFGWNASVAGVLLDVWLPDILTQDQRTVNRQGSSLGSLKLENKVLSVLVLSESEGSASWSTVRE